MNAASQAARHSHDADVRARTGRVSRRGFLRTSTALAGLAAIGSRAAPNRPIPNILYILCDQLSLNAVGAHGCPWVNTPNLDRLVTEGITFTESHSTNPVCSPARSSLMTGRMPVETGVISNSRPIHDSVPNIGQWLGDRGYETVYCGKWHLPKTYQVEIPGFRSFMVAGQGCMSDPIVSRACEGYLRQRTGDEPFLLVASFMNPHDICYWSDRADELIPDRMPFDIPGDALPPLPPNVSARPQAPDALESVSRPEFSDDQWRYYRWIYYRNIEMMDAELGRVLRALEDTGYRDDTLVVFTSDHGEGGGHHGHVQKWYPYDEALKVPLVLSFPGTIPAGQRDDNHLVSGLDVVPTLCDYAGVEPPPGTRGASLRPLAEGRHTEWRDFIAAECQWVGRVLRTRRYKYVRYRNDPVEQLFDLQEDPWETKNLWQEPALKPVLEDHRNRLDKWLARLDRVKPTPLM